MNVFEQQKKKTEEYRKTWISTLWARIDELTDLKNTRPRDTVAIDRLIETNKEFLQRFGVSYTPKLH